jgi:hypothetical protein
MTLFKYLFCVSVTAIFTILILLGCGSQRHTTTFKFTPIDSIPDELTKPESLTKELDELLKVKDEQRMRMLQEKAKKEKEQEGKVTEKKAEETKGEEPKEIK